MNKIIRSAAVLAALAIATAAQASEKYNFSYKYANGDVVSGSFYGNATGNTVTDLTNITASFDGVALTGSGSLFGSSFDPTTWSWVSGGAVASFDGTANNFMLADVDFPNNPNLTSFFYSVSAYLGSYASTSAGNAYDASVTRTWSLTSAVPEPANGALLAAGLGLMGLMLRRKSAQK